MKPYTLPEGLLRTPGQPAIRLEFARVGNRFDHRISLIDRAGRFILLLESVTGDDHRDCPPSPVFQELRQSRIASDEHSGDAVMLLGAAGVNRWSACVSQDDDQDDETDDTQSDGRFTFDVACRCQGPAMWLGSTYRISPGVRAELSRGKVELTWRTTRISVTPLPLRADDVSASCNVAVRDGIVELTCTQPCIDAPATLRWRYAIEQVA